MAHINIQHFRVNFNSWREKKMKSRETVFLFDAFKCIWRKKRTNV